MEIVGFLYRMAAVAAFMVVAFVLVSYYWTKRTPEQHQRFKEALKYALRDTGRKLPVIILVTAIVSLVLAVIL